MKIVAIIQSRLSSTRLPKKILKRLPIDHEKTVIDHVIKRAKQVKLIDEVVVATSSEESDQEIVDYCKRNNECYFVGSLEDVLERYFLCAKQYEADIIVRLTSDCPCLDPCIVNEIIESHLDTNADFTSSILNRTLPYGIDCGVVNFNALQTAHLNAHLEQEREHVMPYIYKTHRADFKINEYQSDEYYEPALRLTLDTQEDYMFLSAIFDELFVNNPLFKLNDVLQLLEKKPWLRLLNKHITQKKVNVSLEEELQELRTICENRKMKKALDYLSKNGIM